MRYLTLFRSETRALAWSRALKLAQEVLEISADHAALEAALVETVEALRAKAGKPLSNHNYLKRVLENVPATGIISVPVETTAGRAPTSKRAAGIGALENWKRG